MPAPLVLRLTDAPNASTGLAGACQARGFFAGSRPLTPAAATLVDQRRIALVGNSDRGLVRGTGGGGAQTVSVLDTAAALAHRPALIGSVSAGLFPRDVSIDPASGTVLLANFNSGTVEEFSVPNL